MKNIAVTAWTGMTVRNLFFSEVIDELTDTYKVRILSYYGAQLETFFLKKNENLTFGVLENPRWNLPIFRGWFSYIIEDWNYHALWQLHHPATQSRHMRMRKEVKPIKYLFILYVIFNN